MSGRILPGLPIAVDYWEPIKKPHGNFRKYIHFLTHVHSDQIKGLSSEWKESIYTSKMNANFLVEVLKIEKSLCKILDVCTSYKITLGPQIGQDNKYVILMVTAIEAHHIRGSVMYLFQGDFGNVLYTGDFRWCDTLLQNPTLKRLSQRENLDVVYIDNTYEEIGHEFPSREKAIEMVIKIVREHKYHRIIFGCPTFGKEDVLVRVAQATKEKIYVPANVRQIYNIMEVPDVFTTDQTSSLFWFSFFKQSTYSELKDRNRDHPTIAINLTASGSLLKSNNNSSDYIYTIPYTNHSTASELSKFLKFLKPKRVERIVPHNGAPDKMTAIDGYFAQLQVATESEYFSTESGSADESESFQTPVKSENDQSSCPSNVPELANLDEILSKADKLIRSLEADMDNHGDEIITHEKFAKKLVALTRLYEPLTGIHMIKEELQ